MYDTPLLSAMYKIVPSVVPVVLIYLICHLGQYVTQHYVRLGNEWYAVSWYVLPSNLQKNWTIMIRATQKPIELRAFGSHSLNRETYMQVNVS